VLTEAVIEKMPVSVQKYARAILPVLEQLGNFLNMLTPAYNFLWSKATAVAKFLEPYHPKLLMKMAAGIVMMMFGGFFVLTIAAFEAFRLGGWENFQIAFGKMYTNYLTFMEGNKKDDEIDADGDGVADVLQGSSSSLITRKIKVFMVHTNPEEISLALGALYTGLLGVVAALRIEFAKTIALGATIGECIESPLKKFVEPIAQKMAPKEYHSWIRVGLEYVARSIGVSIAWFLQRIISAVHSAIRGGTMFTKAFSKFTGKLGYGMLSEGYFDEAFAIAASLFGLYFQLVNVFVLPWYMALLLFPVLCIEGFLQILMTIS